jgi:hypothetical protein
VTCCCGGLGFRPGSRSNAHVSKLRSASHGARVSPKPVLATQVTGFSGCALAPRIVGISLGLLRRRWLSPRIHSNAQTVPPIRAFATKICCGNTLSSSSSTSLGPNRVLFELEKPCPVSRALVCRQTLRLGRRAKSWSSHGLRGRNCLFPQAPNWRHCLRLPAGPGSHPNLSPRRPKRASGAARVRCD